MVAAPRPLTRRVLYAVELADAVTGARVSERIDLQPLDANGKTVAGRPVLNASRRFVWLEGAVWPDAMRVTPAKGSPFAARTEPIKAPAADPTYDAQGHTALPPDGRLRRILLSPTAAYPFAGATAVRGMLTEDGDPAHPIADAIVQLARKSGANWVPAAADPAAPRVAIEAVTDAKGEFAVFLPLAPKGAEADAGPVQVRLQVTRADQNPATRVTPPSSTTPSLPNGGRIDQGRLVEVRLRWDQLVAP
jgi:hypothetical protein